MQEKIKTKKTSPQKASRKNVSKKNTSKKSTLEKGASKKNAKLHTSPSKVSKKNLLKDNITYFNKTSIISIIILIITLCVTCFFYSLNSYIREVFDNQHGQNAKILTDNIKIKANALLNKEILKDFLKELNYILVNEIPQNEGEYFEKVTKDEDIIYLFRRNISNNNNEISKELYTLNYKENRLTCTINKDCKEFILDALPINSNKNSKDRSEYLTLKKFNKNLINALITIEDKRFYNHIGIDLKGIFRAIYINVINWKTKQGASTITQQLVKNLFLTNEKKLKRKLKEAFLSIYIEFLYSKDEVLEKYLNLVYLGQDKNTAIKGFQEASKFYFNKDVNNLNISEISTLVGMIKAPSTYSPILNYKKALFRKNVVLKKLYDEKIISKQTFLEESLKDIKLNVKRKNETIDNYFYDALLANIPSKHSYKISSIKTSLNPLFQICANNSVNKNLNKIKTSFPYLEDIEASLVTLDSQTGLILSYIGGKDYKLSQFDRVRLSKRQIGSLIKPFIYLAALDPKLNTYKQATPISTLKDEPIVLLDANKRKWRPQNFDKKFRGYVTLREALEKSLNVPTVNLAQKIGLKTIIKLLNKVKISNLNDKTLAISLGAIDLSLLEIVSAYSTFSNEGHFIAPRFYSEIYDNNNEILYRSNIDEKNVASKEATFILNTILNGVFRNGTARSASEFGDNLYFAGKTGTSNSQKDNWFIGFNKNLVTGVWVGLDDNKKMPFTGATSSLPIWKDYTNCILQYVENESFQKPENVEEVYINKLTFDKCDLQDSQKNENSNCYKEYFIKNKNSNSQVHDTFKNVKDISKNRSFFKIVEN